MMMRRRRSIYGGTYGEPGAAGDELQEGALLLLVIPEGGVR